MARGRAAPDAWPSVRDFLDTYLVDGLVTGVALVPRVFGRELLAPFQNGLIQFYAAGHRAGRGGPAL